MPHCVLLQIIAGYAVTKGDSAFRAWQLSRRFITIHLPFIRACIYRYEKERLLYYSCRKYVACGDLMAQLSYRHYFSYVFLSRGLKTRVHRSIIISFDVLSSSKYKILSTLTARWAETAVEHRGPKRMNFPFSFQTQKMQFLFKRGSVLPRFAVEVVLV